MENETTDGPQDDADAASTSSATGPTTDGTRLDLDAIERDLADVEVALSRLDAGTYWTDEVTGAPIADETLATNPVTRRA